MTLKLAGLYNREEPRVINMRANDCLSTEYCPGKKCRGVKGENKIWTPTNKPVTSTGSPQVLDGSSSQPAPTSQAEPCPPLGAGWGHMEKAEEPVMLSEDNQTENVLQSAV